MESLIQIVDILKQPELRMLRGYYKVKQNKEPSKKLELLNLITSGKVKTDKEAIELLYGKTNATSGYSHLKERLKTDLLNTILFLNPEKIYKTIFAKKKLECRKLIIQADLLYNRSEKEMGKGLLKKALSMAIKYEFPNLEMEIRSTLREEASFEGKAQIYWEHTRRMEKCLILQQAIFNTKTHFYNIKYINKSTLNTLNQNKISISDALVEIEEYIKKTKSVRVRYWYYFIAVNYYINIEKNHQKGIELQIEFIHLIEKEAAVKSKSALAGTNMQLAHVYLLINEYEKALKPAQKAVNTFRKDSFNFLRALEIQFWAHLRNQDLEAAEEDVRTAFKHKNISKSAYFSAKWNYLKANLMFLIGDLSAAHEFLLQSDELTKDKTGWYIGFKLLLIYITFEQGNYYWLESQLENFRKLLSRNKNVNLNRAKTIHKIAHALLQNDGDFSKVKEINKKDIKLLQDAKGDMQWDPTGYEVVRFDDWFCKKI